MLMRGKVQFVSLLACHVLLAFRKQKKLRNSQRVVTAAFLRNFSPVLHRLASQCFQQQPLLCSLCEETAPAALPCLQLPVVNIAVYLDLSNIYICVYSCEWYIHVT